MGTGQTREVPLPVPEFFKFENYDTEKNLEELYKFLKENYVEDEGSEFRLIYSREFLKWQLESSIIRPEYCLGLRYKGELIGFIFGKEHLLCLKRMLVKTLGINFLCIKIEFRKRRIAPVLIREIKRRANLNGINSAIFTGGIELPFSSAKVRYYHRVI